MKQVTEYWNQCLEYIRDNTTDSAYRAWFAPIVPVQYDGTTLILKVPSAYFVDYLEEHFIELLSSAIHRYISKDAQLEYRVEVDSQFGNETTLPSDHNMERHTAPVIKSNNGVNYHPQHVQLPELDPQLNPSYNMNTFVEGRSNKLARTAGISIATEPGNNAFNPFFVYGRSGVGKTHLGNAIGIMTKQLHPEKRVLYVSAATFQQQFTEAHLRNSINDFLNFYQTIDVLIIDDVHELAGKTATQNNFFHIFNHLHQSGKQLILTCDRSPMELEGIEERLLTRFKWGLSAEIEHPDFQLRRDILKNKIYRDGLDISDEVVNFIAQHVKDNIRDLEGVLVSLMAHSTLLNVPIDVELTRKVVGRVVNLAPDTLTIDQIRQAVCNFYHVSPAAIDSSSRQRDVSQARQVAMYLCKKHTDNSFATIGRKIGNRSHATVMHAVQVVEDTIGVDKAYRKDIEDITHQLTK